MNLVCSLMLAVSALTSLQKALDSCADWTMARTLPGSERVLRSSGNVRCKSGAGIVWETKMPFVASVEMTTNAMIFVDEEGRRVKPLNELPHYAEFREATDNFVAGDTNAFDGVFAISERRLADGGWALTLTPEVSAMKRLFTSIELTGAALPTNAVLKTGDGGQSVIRFKELPRDR